jgi:4-amino-4-deoxy-L-arabinose transferase-like glycosyltransferase
MGNQQRYLKCALIASVAILFLNLGHRALWDPDEGRYAEMAREILVLHDWVSPHLNYLLYFEKPMMYIWLVAISFKTFGISEWAAHLVSLISALGGVFLIGLMARKLWGYRAGLVASLSLLSSLEYFFLASAVDINMTLTLFITSAMVFFWFGHMENKPLYFTISWASMALATLTKGPIGIILPLGAISLYIILSRQYALIKEARPIPGILIFLAISLPWYIIVSMRNPDFLSFFFVKQNLLRYAASHEHNQPLYYFPLVILVGVIPWTFMLPSAIKGIWHRKMPMEIIYILTWFLLILLFFTPSQSKLVSYVLPSFPPFSLIMGYTLKDIRTNGWSPLYAAGILSMFIGISLIFFPVLASHGVVNIPLAGLAPLISIGAEAGAIITLGAVMAILLGRKYDNALGLAIISLSAMVTITAFAPKWDTLHSTKSLVQGLPSSARLCAYRGYYPSSSFYSGKQVILVESTGELEFGIKHNREKNSILSINDLTRMMKSDKNTYCLTSIHHLPSLHEKIPGFVIVRKSSSLCLLNVPAT